MSKIYGIKLDQTNQRVDDFQRTCIELLDCQMKKNQIYERNLSRMDKKLDLKNTFRLKTWKNKWFLATFMGYMGLTGYLIVKGRHRVTSPQLALMFIGPMTVSAI